jgi:hypothetical protein
MTRTHHDARAFVVRTHTRTHDASCNEMTHEMTNAKSTNARTSRARTSRATTTTNVRNERQRAIASRVAYITRVDVNDVDDSLIAHVDAQLTQRRVDAHVINDAQLRDMIIAHTNNDNVRRVYENHDACYASNAHDKNKIARAKCRRERRARIVNDATK